MVAKREPACAHIDAHPHPTTRADATPPSSTSSSVSTYLWRAALGAGERQRGERGSHGGCWSMLARRGRQMSTPLRTHSVLVGGRNRQQQQRQQGVQLLLRRGGRGQRSGDVERWQR